ncbi:preprotein translocase subunit SecE [Tumidithrix helvetica PCC 7403]|uniref:Protein translocase subunit SecE n=1 Tax=Tumidithrix elongata BACA0141 TaxID=2716417 RepID=A0AAW9Q1U1_9CYAN|nr:preprotein translocase subunit SecE [Tumidithrix elongata RA019]
MTKNEVKDLKESTKESDSSGGFNLGNFFKETQVEFSKVVWPTRQQLFSESAAVLLMVVAAATLIYLVDALFRWTALQVFH